MNSQLPNGKDPWDPPGIDVSSATPARTYAAYTDDRDAFEADRKLAAAVKAFAPDVAERVRDLQAFAVAAAREMAGTVGQILDIGAGRPIEPVSVYAAARHVNPNVRLAAVDCDPVELAHLRAEAHEPDRIVVQADAREPGELLSALDRCTAIDWDRPVGVILGALLHFLTDVSLVNALRARMLAGSMLAISHACSSGSVLEAMHGISEAYADQKITVVWRTDAQIANLFAGARLLPPPGSDEPGLADPRCWRDLTAQSRNSRALVPAVESPIQLRAGIAIVPHDDGAGTVRDATAQVQACPGPRGQGDEAAARDAGGGPGELLADPGLRQVIDFDQPVGVLLGSVLQFVTDAEGPDGILAALREPMASGSHLMITHVTGGGVDEHSIAAAVEIYRPASPVEFRSAQRVRGFFEGLDPNDPGLVVTREWHPEGQSDDPTTPSILIEVGWVGMKTATVERHPLSPTPFSTSTQSSPRVADGTRGEAGELPGPVRVGVFYDGGWFSHLWRWFGTDSQWKAAPTFAGIHDAVRFFLSTRLMRKVGDVQVVTAHYVLGRPGGTSDGGRPPQAGSQWDQILSRNGIIRHDAGYAAGHEVGADELLHRVVDEQAAERALQVVVLITGDAGFRPLVDQLCGQGIVVVIPAIDETDSGAAGRGWRITTPAALLDGAAHTPAWTGLMSAALDPAYLLLYPFTGPVPGAVSRPACDGWRYGTVNRWRSGDCFGFITDRGGIKWFADRGTLPEGRDRLREGQPVRFTGGRAHEHGQKYPRARTVQPIDV
jgi:cold shock CspA family protein